MQQFYLLWFFHQTWKTAMELLNNLKLHFIFNFLNYGNLIIAS